MRLYKGDIVLTSSPDFIGRAIRFFQRSPKETESVVNHVGVITEYSCWPCALLVESLAQGTVERDLFSAYMGSKDKVAIYRHTGLLDPQRDAIARKAKEYVGRKYGYIKIAAHALDYFLGGRYVFRRICRMDKYPYCSWVASHVYKPFIRFLGLDPDMVQPDDIWDECIRNSAWQCIYPLGKLVDKDAT